MQKKTFIILTVDEAKNALVNHFANFLINSPTHLFTLLSEGKLEEVPNFVNITSSEVVEAYRNNGLGAVYSDVDGVAVDNDGLQIVF